MKGKVEQLGLGNPEHELQALRDLWAKFEVENVMLGVAEKFNLPGDFVPPVKNERRYRDLVSRKVIYGSPGLSLAINIHKPRIVSAIMSMDGIWDVNDGAHWEEKTVYNHAYAIGLNGAGFYARYKQNRPTFLERPEGIRGGARGLMRLVDQHIEVEKHRNVFSDIFFANIPRNK